MPLRAKEIRDSLVFAAAYVALDWASYLHPLHGLNITPWNPSLALGLVHWFRHGRSTALPWFAAILVSELLVRGMPASIGTTLALAATLAVGYGVMAEILRRRLNNGQMPAERQGLLAWGGLALLGTLANSLLFVLVLSLSGLIPIGDGGVAWIRFWIGDFVGIVVTMPFFWLLLDADGRRRILNILKQPETAAQAFLGVAMLAVSFGWGGVGEFQFFYLLFLPIVWAAARQGLEGAAVAAFFLQAGVVVCVQLQNLVAVTVFELQLLGAVLAFVGLFIGAVVDEKQKVSMELRQTLRLAAAAEMAAALAHELNQPLAALSAYGAASKQLLDKGETGERLVKTISLMLAESRRAADVVRGLRDFFRTGPTHLESIPLQALLEDVVARFKVRGEQLGASILLSPALPQSILGDRAQLDVVLRNLVANALDAVSTQPSASRVVTISTLPWSRNRICIQVEDTGKGLSHSEVTRVFEAFKSTKASGLGLGLAVSRTIAEAHGGMLLAEPGPHGVFRLILPLEG